MKDFLREIGITKNGNMSDDGCYIIDFDNDTEWSKANSILDKSNLVDEEEDSSNVAIEAVTIQYVGDDYTITMMADFDSDNYRLICREN